MFLKCPHGTEAVLIQRDRRQRYRILGLNKENLLSQRVTSAGNLGTQNKCRSCSKRCSRRFYFKMHFSSIMHQKYIPLVNSCINSAAKRSGKEIIAEELAFCLEQWLISDRAQTWIATGIITI